jgi:hypothetical protein
MQTDDCIEDDEADESREGDDVIPINGMGSFG